MTFFQALPWHAGENAIHALTRVPYQDNPTQPLLTPRAAQNLSRFPLMALGTVDDEGRLWSTLWGSGREDGASIAQPVAPGGVIGMKVLIDATFDPVAAALFETKTKPDGDLIKAEHGQGRMVSGLSIHLEERNRVKLFGRMVAGALKTTEEAKPSNQKEGEERGGHDGAGEEGKVGNAQLVIHITQSMGNCPKYLNKKVISSYNHARPRLVSESTRLPPEAIDLIRQTDMFFVSSKGPEDMDTNYRGGPPGFLRVHQADGKEDDNTVLVWPEYSGNNLYQTLGNFLHDARAGLVVPNLSTGDVLYVTGQVEVLVDDAARALIAKTKLAVKLTVTGARFVTNGLCFRGKNVEDPSDGRSPYNPRVRYLQSEQEERFQGALPDDNRPGHAAEVTAKLIKKTQLTPTIWKYRFALSDPKTLGPWQPGQHVALDFSGDMYMGYSHMRNDDPQSLNDDFLRTFTVSSAPDSLGIHGEEFEIMVRKVGAVTKWLTWQKAGQTEVGVRGFGGDFRFDRKSRIGFVAAGIGITPLLGQMQEVKDQRLQVFWSTGIKDVGLVMSVLGECPIELQKNITVFLSGDETVLDDLGRDQLKSLISDHGQMKIERRRVEASDLTKAQDLVEEWYLCTAPAMRSQIQQWLPGKSLVFENFNY